MESSRKQEKTPRLPALTGARIFAALAVYASHIGSPAGVPNAIGTFFASGYCGVTMFFVLSGFVLAINYFEDFRRLNVRRAYGYFIARFARIYPLYILVIFFFIVRQHTFGQSIDGWWRSALALQAWDLNLSHVFAFDPPAWSLSVEFFLYACFPLMVPLLARLRQPKTVLMAAGVSVAVIATLAAWFTFTGKGALVWTNPASAHRWLYLMPLTRLGDFALGILTARLYLETKHRKSIARLGLPLIVGTTVAVVGLMSWPNLIFTPWSWDLAYGVPAAIFIFGLAIAPLSWPARFLSLPFIVLLGEASYAFYLVHDPAIGFLNAGGWSAGISMSMTAYEVLALGAILALAVGLHVTIERPARTYIRRVLVWRERPTPLVTPSPQSEPVSP